MVTFGNQPSPSAFPPPPPPRELSFIKYTQELDWSDKGREREIEIRARQRIEKEAIVKMREAKKWHDKGRDQTASKKERKIKSIKNDKRNITLYALYRSLHITFDIISYAK